MDELTTTSDPIKILFVVGTLNTGGAERFVSNCLELLDRSRFKPILALFRMDIGYPLPGDVEVTDLGKYRPWHIPKAIWRLARLIDAEKPDIVLSAWSFPNLITSEALRLARTQPFWYARIANDPAFDETGLIRLWAHRAYRRANGIIAISKGVAQSHKDIYAQLLQPVSVLYNPTPFDRIDQAALEPIDIPLPQKPILLAVGRISKQKRHDLLLMAFKKVRQNIDASLVILGTGPMTKIIEKKIEELSLQEHVHMLGYVANPYKWMSVSDLFVLSSDAEGLCNALIEAQGLGIPAVSTDCPYGPNEVIDDQKTGLLVTPGDSDALANAILDLLSDPQRRIKMGIAARETSRNHFSAQQKGLELMEFLENSLRA